MADKTKIEWTDSTWNPITGCTLVSDGCSNCYAANLAATRLKHHASREGLARLNAAGVAKFTGEVRFNKQWLDQPLRWKKPRKIFVCAHGDLFHENVPDEWIDDIFAVMALCPQHIFQVLTKRPERMLEYMTSIDNNDGTRIDGFRDALIEGAAQSIYAQRNPGEDPSFWLSVNLPLPNVWLGTSVEDQKSAEARIPFLLDTPAAFRWISAEPLLDQISLVSDLGGTLWMGGQRGCDGTHRHGGKASEVIHGDKHEASPQLPHHHHDNRCRRGLDWVVLGGESGRNARPMHPDWARLVRDQCSAANVPFLMKQWGVWLPWSQFNGSVGDDPEQTRFETLEWNAAQEGGGWTAVGRPMWFDSLDGDIDENHCVGRVGKKAAGRILDGVIHNAFPKVGAL